MSKENERFSENIACIDALNMRATLVSTQGAHCDVWRSTGILMRNGTRTLLDVVIKHHRQPCPFPEIRLLGRDYRELKSRLDTIVPSALFVATRVDGAENVVVVAEAITPWFNLANPVYESEAVPLVRHLPQARGQLSAFVKAARAWRDQDNAKIIDLYGLDNLVLDVDRQVKYIDSFNVFFYCDLLYAIDDVDEQLRDKIEVSQQRLEYLEYVLQQSHIVCIPTLGF